MIATIKQVGLQQEQREQAPPQAACSWRQIGSNHNRQYTCAAQHRNAVNTSLGSSGADMITSVCHAFSVLHGQLQTRSLLTMFSSTPHYSTDSKDTGAIHCTLLLGLRCAVLYLQIDYSTVFFFEYFGPLVIYPLFFFLPQIFYPGQK
jgi:hypothetical protein